MIPLIFEIPLPFGLGYLPIYSFGLMMVCCFLSAWKRLYLSLQEAGENPELAERMITWAAIGGVLGARIFYIFSYFEDFLRDPIGLLFGGAGFVFYGGFIGGALAAYILLRKEGKSFFQMADITAPALALGYAVGRVGCQLSGDGDYGSQSTLPWAIAYPLGVVPTEAGQFVHPTPVYESLISLLIVYILLHPKIKLKLGFSGQLFGLYLFLSAISRFMIEFIRIEPIILGGLTQAQIVSIVLVLVGIVLLGRKRLLTCHNV